MAVDVGNLLVRVGADISDMQRKLDQVEREVSKTTQQVSKSAKAMDVAFQAAALAGVAIAAKRFVDLGAAVEETASKFRTVMGPATQEVQTYLDGFANAAGLSNEQAQGLVATSASIAQGMGFAQESAARFSTEILTLSADLASFNNLPTEEVINAVNSALAGEREQLKRLGIVIREADVQQRAMAESGKDSAAALTLQEKATATLQLITERAGVAVGDLERTQESLANQTKQAAARVEDMRNALAGVVAEGIQASGVIVELNEVFSQIRGSGSTAAAAVKAFFEPIAEFLQDVEEAVIALRGLKNAFVALSEFTKVGLRQAFENFQAAIEASEREIADARAEFERRRDITVDTAAAETEVANAAERTADAMERAANAQRSVSFSLGAPRQSMDPTGRSLPSGLGLDLPALKIPETVKAMEDMGEQAEQLTVDVNALAQDAMREAARATDGMTRAVLDLGSAILAGGAAGGIAGLLQMAGAAIADILAGNQRAEENARRIHDAVGAWDDAFRRMADAVEYADPYVEALARNAEKWEAAFDSLNAAFGGITSLDDLPDRQTVINTLNALSGMGGEAAAEARAFWERVLSIIDASAAAADRIRSSMEAAADAARAAEQARRNELRDDGLRGVVERIVERIGDELARIDFMFGEGLAAGFDPAVAAFQKIRDLVRDGLLPEGVGEQLAADIAEINRLFEEGLISGVEAARLINIILGQASDAQEDYAETIKRSTEAALEAARAEQFRQMVDTENLRVRLLTMQGRSEEAMVLRQSLELLEAVEQGRSAEYISILKQIHAEERAAAARNQATESIQRQTQAAQESARAIDGVARMLNGPAGFTFALYRNRVLRGQSDGFGGSVGGGSSGVRIDQVNVYAAPGQDPRAIASEVIDALGGTVDFRLRAGGFNPLTQSREGF